MAAIEVDGLTVRYDLGGGEQLTAVDGVTFAAEAGEVVVLLGPNGAGKTSTVETLEGYRRPNDGTVRVLGLDPVADHARLMPRIGVMLQEGGIQTGIRALEALRLYAAFHDDPRSPAEVLDRIGLARRHRTTWRRLSGGERQRLSLGLAVINRPEVVFLDEPTAGIDLDGRRLVRELVAELAEGDACVLVTTHDLAEAEEIADRVVIIDRGHLVADDTLDALTGPDGTCIRVATHVPLDPESLAAHLDVPVVELGPMRYRIEAEASAVRLSDLTAWLARHDIAVAELDTGGERLEEIYLRLTGRER